MPHFQIFLLGVTLSVVHFTFSEVITLYDANQEIFFTTFYGAQNIEVVNWFKTQFKPHYKLFEEYTTFAYFPCHDITISSDNKTLTCPQPDTCCYMNKLHACAIEHFKEGPKLNRFILCTLENRLHSVFKCADPNDMKMLEDCAKGDEGFELCYASSKFMLPFSHLPSFQWDGLLKPPFDMTDALCRGLKLRYLKKYPDVCCK